MVWHVVVPFLLTTVLVSISAHVLPFGMVYHPNPDTTNPEDMLQDFQWLFHHDISAIRVTHLIPSLVPIAAEFGIHLALGLSLDDDENDIQIQYQAILSILQSPDVAWVDYIYIGNNDLGKPNHRQKIKTLLIQLRHDMDERLDEPQSIRIGTAQRAQDWLEWDAQEIAHVSDVLGVNFQDQVKWTFPSASSNDENTFSDSNSNSGSDDGPSEDLRHLREAGSRTMLHDMDHQLHLIHHRYEKFDVEIRMTSTPDLQSFKDDQERMCFIPAFYLALLHTSTTPEFSYFGKNSSPSGHYLSQDRHEMGSSPEWISFFETPPRDSDVFSSAYRMTKQHKIPDTPFFLEKDGSSGSSSSHDDWNASPGSDNGLVEDSVTMIENDEQGTSEEEEEEEVEAPMILPSSSILSTSNLMIGTAMTCSLVGVIIIVLVVLRQPRRRRRLFESSRHDLPFVVLTSPSPESNSADSSPSHFRAEEGRTDVQNSVGSNNHPLMEVTL